MLQDKTRVWLNSARFVKGMSGVFTLQNRNKEVIYIGGSPNLQKTFSHFLDTDFEGDKCKQQTKWYQREFVKEFAQRSEQLLEEHKNEFGKLPKCNE